MDRPKFYMLCGLPGSGKTQLALDLGKEFGLHVYSSDVIREELYGDVNCQDHNQEVFKELQQRIKRGLKEGKSCVYDATNMSKKYRISFLRDLQDIECNKYCFVLISPIAICKERNNARSRSVPEEVYDKMLRSFWIPEKYEGWDRIYFLSDKNILQSYPLEIEKTYGFDQQNSHHTKNLFDHMCGTCQYIIKNFDGNRNNAKYMSLLRAAMFHDIGKLYTQSFKDTNGNSTKEAHYYGHENYGAYLYLLQEMYGGMNDIYAAWLINWHMRPIVWSKSERARKRDRALIGEERYKDLMMLHEADLDAR